MFFFIIGTSITKYLFDMHPNVSTIFNDNIKENEGMMILTVNYDLFSWAGQYVQVGLLDLPSFQIESLTADRVSSRSRLG